MNRHVAPSSPHFIELSLLATLHASTNVHKSCTQCGVCACMAAMHWAQIISTISSISFIGLVLLIVLEALSASPACKSSAFAGSFLFYPYTFIEKAAHLFPPRCASKKNLLPWFFYEMHILFKKAPHLRKTPRIKFSTIRKIFSHSPHLNAPFLFLFYQNYTRILPRCVAKFNKVSISKNRDSFVTKPLPAKIHLLQRAFLRSCFLFVSAPANIFFCRISFIANHFLFIFLQISN